MRVVLVALLVIITVVAAQKNNCVSLTSGSKQVKFEWNILSDQLSATVTFPLSSLDKGWLGIGFSNDTGSGMGVADIMFMYTQGKSIYVYDKRSDGSQMPQPSVNTLFEKNPSVSLVAGRLTIDLSKKFVYSGVTESVSIENRNQALLIAYNDVATPVSDTDFAQHTWSSKKIVNFRQDNSHLCASAATSINSVASFYVIALVTIFIAIFTL
jgi:hypothetical protein